jgi:hypothetical protein
MTADSKVPSDSFAKLSLTDTMPPEELWVLAIGQTLSPLAEYYWISGAMTNFLPAGYLPNFIPGGT